MTTGLTAAPRPSRPLAWWEVPVAAVASGVLLLATSGHHSLGLLAVGAVVFAVTSLRVKVVVYLLALAVIGWVKIRYPHHQYQAVPNVLAVITFLHAGWDWVVKRDRIPVRLPYFLLVFFFTIIVILQDFNPVGRAAGLRLRDVGVYLWPLLVFYIGLRFFRDGRDARLFLRVCVVLGLITGLYMLEQLVFGFSQAERHFFVGITLGRIQSEHKLTSTFLGPDVYGFVSGFLSMACVCARAAGVWPRLSVAVAALTAFGAVVCGLRISAFALVIAGGFLFVQLLREPTAGRFAFRALVIGVAAAAALTVAVLGTSAQYREQSFKAGNGLQAVIIKLSLLKHGNADPDVHSRVVRVEDFSHFIVAHPFGAGDGIVRLANAPSPGLTPNLPTRLPLYLQEAPYVFQHDFEYISMGAELGLGALLMFFLILVFGIRNGVRVRRRHVDGGIRAVLLLSSATALQLLVYTSTNEAFRAPQVAGLFWLVLAAPVAYLAAPDPGRERNAARRS